MRRDAAQRSEYRAQSSTSASTQAGSRLTRTGLAPGQDRRNCAVSAARRSTRAPKSRSSSGGARIGTASSCSARGRQRSPGRMPWASTLRDKDDGSVSHPARRIRFTGPRKGNLSALTRLGRTVSGRCSSIWTAAARVAATAPLAPAIMMSIPGDSGPFGSVMAMCLVGVTGLSSARGQCRMKRPF